MIPTHLVPKSHNLDYLNNHILIDVNDFLANLEKINFFILSAESLAK